MYGVLIDNQPGQPNQTGSIPTFGNTWTYIDKILNNNMLLIKIYHGDGIEWMIIFFIWFKIKKTASKSS